MEYFVNCNTSTLAPYTTPLDKYRAAHLYRRLGFSASVQTINHAVGADASTLVNSLINEAVTMAPTPAPAWADWNNSNYPADDDLARQVRRAQSRGMADKLYQWLVEQQSQGAAKLFLE